MRSFERGSAAFNLFSKAAFFYTSLGSDYYSIHTIQPGWLIGAGLEWMFREHWSVRAEYYYINYCTVTLNLPSVYGLIDPNGRAHVDLSSHNIGLAVNYWI